MADFDANQHQLLLDGKYLVEKVSEIANDDELVLKRTDEAILESSTTSPQRVGSMVSPTTASTSVTPVKKEEVSPHRAAIKKETDESTVEVITMLDDDDESAVQPDDNKSQSNPAVGSRGPRAAGVKREAHPIRRVKIKKKKPEIITIDDDSATGDDSSRDGSIEDGSIEDGSDAWMSSDEEEEDSDENDDESDFEPDSDDDDFNSENETEMQKIKGKASKRSKESPLQVLMDEKDVPAAPGKREGKNEENEEEEVSLLVNGAGRQKTEKAVKDRIMKLLNTGFHDQSNEHEAKNAMKLAQVRIS